MTNATSIRPGAARGAGPARRAPRFEALERGLRAALTGPVIRDVDLRTCSRWRVGGTGALLVEPASVGEMREAVRLVAEAGAPKLVIGDGSNLLFDDGGFDGVLIRLGRRLSRVAVEGTRVTAEGGVWVPHLVRRLGRLGLAGLQHAIGIPGTLGGLVCMNGGSQRKGIGLNVVAVRGCDEAGRPFERDAAACRFRYRGSTLQDDGLVILEADLAFTRADPGALRREMIAILAGRRAKFPKNLPNCGSVFLSNPSMYEIVGPPGAAIERVGLKGLRAGGAQISPLHANFIVNCGTATSADILSLVHRARTDVHAATGFSMDCEVRHVAPDGVVTPAHEAAAARIAREAA